MTSHYTKLSHLYGIKDQDCYHFLYELTLPDDMVLDSVIEHIRWCLKDCDTLDNNPIVMFTTLIWECYKSVNPSIHSSAIPKLEAAMDVYSAYCRDVQGIYTQTTDYNIEKPKKLFWTSILSVMTGITATKVFEIIDKVLDITVDYDYYEHN